MELIEIFVEKKRIQLLEKKLECSGLSFNNFLKLCIATGLAGAGTIGISSFWIEFFREFFVATAALGFVLPCILLFFIVSYKYESQFRKKESAVPESLLSASSFPSGTTAEEILKKLGEEENALAQEFKKASQEIRLGADFDKALMNLGKRVQSPVVDRAVELLVQAYGSGADMSLAFRQAAEDMLETESIIRERRANLIIQKYTLLFAGGILVPLVLGLLEGVVSGIDFSMLEELSFGGTKQYGKELADSAGIASFFYLAEYALIASAFVAFMEGNRKNFFFYAVILLPLSFFSYFAGKIISMA